VSVESFESDGFTTYYQAFDGTIRWMHFTGGWQGGWTGGSSSAIVANDAKNGTPISAMAYQVAPSGAAAFVRWNIFYVDIDGHIRQKSNSNITNTWVDGTINSLNLAVYSASPIALQACWYGNLYTNASSLEIPLINGTSPDPGAGMRLWYPSDESTWQQYSTYEGASTWTVQKPLQAFSAHAGFTCNTELPGTVDYIMGVTSHDTVELWWEDSSSTLASTQAHPVGSWTNSKHKQFAFYGASV
jgi:hypothetical protein